MIKLSSLDTLHNGTLVGHLQQKSQIIWTGKWFKLTIDLRPILHNIIKFPQQCMQFKVVRFSPC